MYPGLFSWSDDTIKEAKLGLCENNGLSQYLLSQGLSLELAKQIGIISTNGDEFFQDRLVIPYFLKGRVMYLSGRVLDNTQQPKYKNLPANGLVERIPYNADAIYKKDKLIIVEGFSDALTLKEWGFGVISMSGTGITDREINMLKKQQTIFIVWTMMQRVNL